MSSGARRKVSCQDLQVVQDLIKRCLQQYMSEKEVVETLSTHAKIEPDFTELVWQSLVEQNREFFKAYHVRLMVKHQIKIFNELLEKQVELMHEMCTDGFASQPPFITHSSMHQAPSCFVSENKFSSSFDNIHDEALTSTMLDHGRQMVHGSMHSSGDASAHAGRIDAFPNVLLTHNSDLGAVPGVGGAMIKSESGYPYSSAFAFGNGGFVHYMHPTIEVPVSSHANEEPDPPLNLSFLDTSSFGFFRTDSM